MRTFKTYLAEQNQTYRYYISSGAQNAQYTLRKSFDEVVWYSTVGGPQSSLRHRDRHVVNLGINPEKAQEKAKTFVEKIKQEFPNEKIILDTNIGGKPLSKYSKWGDSLRFGKYKGVSIDTVLKDDPDYLLWAYTSNAPLRDDQKEFIKKNLKTEIDKIEKEKKDKEDQAKRDALRALHQDQMAKTALEKINVGDILHTTGKIVKKKWSEGRFSSLQFTLVCKQGFLAWFQTTKDEFAGLEDIQMQDKDAKWTEQRPKTSVGDVIEFQMLVSGKGDKIVFGKKPKLIKKVE